MFAVKRETKIASRYRERVRHNVFRQERENNVCGQNNVFSLVLLPPKGKAVAEAVVLGADVWRHWSPARLEWQMARI